MIDAAGTKSDAAVAEAQGLGATLKALREARRISLSEASTRLKYSVRQLEALEDERWSQLPTGMSLRGLVKNYGKLLETEAAPLMQLLDRAVGPTDHPHAFAGPGLGGAAVRMPAAPVDPEHRSSWGWLLVILILLIVAGVYAVERGWIPESWLAFEWLKSL